MVLSLEYLPQEILLNILCYCDPLSAVALESTCRRLRGVTNEPILWRFYCRTSFRYWDSRHDMPNKLAGPVHQVDWKALYISRHLVGRATINFLDDILRSQTGRIEKFRTIIAYGYDIKDALLQNTQADSSVDDYLARRLVFCASLGLDRFFFLTMTSKLLRERTPQLSPPKYCCLRMGEDQKWRDRSA